MRVLPSLLTAILIAAGCTAGDRSEPSEQEQDRAVPVPAESAGVEAAAAGPADAESAVAIDDDAPEEARVPPPGWPTAKILLRPRRPDADGAQGAASRTAESDAAPAPDTGRAFVFPRPDHVRGIYVNAWSAGSRRRIAALSDLARRTEINTFVVDIKDATGYVSHPTGVPLANEIGATGEIRVPNLRVLLGRLEEAGVYPIARIVIVKDPLLAAARPDLAVQDTAGGPWVDDKGIVWLNPHHREVWDYHVAIAREVAAMGFPEIQWDYVRFPDAPASAMRRASFPGAEGRSRSEAIRAFLAYSRDALADLDVQVTADVFGVTTSASGDVGIGQVWESFIDVVDVALPMVYPSHYWTGSFGYEEPNARPYEIVREALERALSRSARVEGAGATRPWLQDFTLGPPRYEAPEVRAQIQAAYDVGIEEWILWNPGSRYTEAGLEPVAGFAEEPLMRVGSEIVPVSQRFEHFDTVSVSAEPEAPDSAGARPDTASAPRAPGGTGNGRSEGP